MAVVCRPLVPGVLLVLLSAVPLAGQGITSAAIQGRVTSAAGGPISWATVAVTNSTTGQRWAAAVTANGRYLLESVPVGGPYRIEARAIGFAPAARTGIGLSLGRSLTADFVLEPTSVELPGINVVARRLTNGTGQSQSIADSLLRRAPILNRDVLSLVRESPQVTSGVNGISIGGQNPRHNSYQIDGGVNNSLFGGFSSTPGSLINLLAPPGGGGLRTVALDAVEELVVLAAPFDVRQGNFSGGLINIVTKSGNNVMHGSGFGTLQNSRLVGRDLDNGRIPNFTTGQFGASLSGPILRDRLHYFLAADIQQSGLPYSSPLIGSDTAGGRDSIGVGIQLSSASRFQRILRDRYGVDAGSFGPVSPRNPATSLFGKLTLQTGVNGRLEVSQNYVRGLLESPILAREPYGFYDLTSADTRFRSTTAATRASWKALLGGRLSEELTVAHLRIRDLCEPLGTFAHVTALADRGILSAGHQPICPGLPVEQTILELTNNLSFLLGSHRLTLGTHDELLRFRDPSNFYGSGSWEFGSLDSLDLGLPNHYTRTLGGPLRPEGTVADFRVHQLGAYLQDEWSPVKRLVLTLGIRLDVPIFPDRPPSNPDLLSALGVNTGASPYANPLWSPRVGVHFDLARDGSTVLRGGVGVFSGRPAYVFPADAFRSTGLEQFFLDCVGDDTPAFTLDPARQPSTCRAGHPIGAPRVAFFDPHYRFPQELKLAIGFDRQLPGRLAGTVDLLYSRGINEPYFIDVNLAPSSAVLTGEAGRALYGTLDGSEPRPNRYNPAFTSVVKQTTSAGNRSFLGSIQLSRPLSGGLGVQAAYTFSDVRDLMLNGGGLGFSLSGYGLAADQIGGTVLDGTPDRRHLRTSALEVRHKVRLTAMTDLPWGVQLAGIFEGASGTPFTYVVDGDINADGFGPGVFGQESNDPVYIPRSAAPDGDVTLVGLDGAPAPPDEYARLEAFIQAEPCLRVSRGTLLRRNRCRNPWASTLDVRLTKTMRAGKGRALDLSLDVFNLLHLIDRNWGVVKRTADFGLEEVPLLQLAGYDAVHDRGVYRLDLRDRRHADFDLSRWRMQFGARYVF